MSRRTDPANGPLRPYLRELAAAPLLDAQEERDLAARVAQGDPEARDRLARCNLRLVVRIAREYLGRGLALEDLVAEGNLGLMRAVEGFDPGRGVRFSTYASYWVKQALRTAVRRYGRFVRLPAYAHVLMAKWKRAEAVLAVRLGRPPEDREVGAALGLSPRKYAVALQALAAWRLTPYEEPEGDDGADPFGGEAAPGASPEEQAAWREEAALAAGAVAALDPREAAVLRLRLGLDGGRPLTLREAAKAAGLGSGERVRQVERQAMGRLREALAVV